VNQSLRLLVFWNASSEADHICCFYFLVVKITLSGQFLCSSIPTNSFKSNKQRQ